MIRLAEDDSVPRVENAAERHMRLCSQIPGGANNVSCTTWKLPGQKKTCLHHLESSGRKFRPYLYRKETSVLEK
ncbi:MAG TPA: hypothetical protein VIH57_20915 [Bacteroidales bacterium]